MARTAPDAERVPEPPMTPMIDVVFQLLIFFMLTMHFKEVEGMLLTQLPRDRGMTTSAPPPSELQEIRVILCSDPKEIGAHVTDRIAHAKVPKEDGRCRILVQRIEIGDLHKTSAHPDKAESNKKLYRDAALRVRDLVRTLPVLRDGKTPPVVIDTDGETPYEHVIGIIDACKSENVGNIEFAPNPRFTALERKK